MTKYLILGTAGHIDHGKTTLIRALTGTETDRLPEEKKRGITIELGYASLQLGDVRMGIVDVPGHEKFVRQMLAGATGMDIALLIIAADDSVKQQTREHFSILKLLGLRVGVIALTKIDLVEEEWCELVTHEIRELVAGTFLTDAPIVPVSSKTGQGIEDLKRALSEAAQQITRDEPGENVQAPFRMAIDRTFAVEGFGTVVTGSVSSGQVSVGEFLEIQPQGLTVKVRGLQNHDENAQHVSRGQRAAINLTGVHHDQVLRGDELATVGHLQPTLQLGIELQVLEDLEKPIKDRQRVRLHIGTTEVAANLRLPKSRNQLAPGETGVAILYLSGPVVAVWGQPYVIRWESPALTLGGGRVLFANRLQTPKPTTLDWKYLQQLDSIVPEERVAATVFLLGFSEWKTGELPRLAGVNNPDSLLEPLVAQRQLLRIVLSKERQLLVHRDRISELTELIASQLERLHRQFPLRMGHPIVELRNRFSYLPTPEIFNNAVKSMSESGRLVVSGTTVSLEGYGPKLSKGERLLFEDIIRRLQKGGFIPETPKQITESTSKNRDSIPQLIKLGVEGQQLVQITEDWVVHIDAWYSALEQLHHAFLEKPELTVSEIKDVFGFTRKHAVPFCEYLDRHRITLRRGDVRVWVNAPTDTPTVDSIP